MKTSDDKTVQTLIETSLVEYLTKLMVLALKKKDKDVAFYVEQIGQALEQLGFFQNVETAFLPFSTTSSDTAISDYIEDEKAGIVGLKDAALYDIRTKWGIPESLELESHVIDLIKADALGQIMHARDFEKEKKLDKAKASKFQAIKITAKEGVRGVKKQEKKNT